jgi:hypothetical protein
MVPWIILMVVLIFFMIMTFMFFGVKEGDIAKSALGKQKQIIYWVVIIFIVIFLASISKVMFAGGGQTTTTTVTETTGTGTGIAVNESQAGTVGQAAFWATLFHPKVLGAVFILLLAVFAVMLLAKGPEED